MSFSPLCDLCVSVVVRVVLSHFRSFRAFASRLCRRSKRPSLWPEVIRWDTENHPDDAPQAAYHALAEEEAEEEGDGGAVGFHAAVAQDGGFQQASHQDAAPEV